MNIALADELATATLAARLLQALPRDLAGWTLLLSGELGAGKSTFARALIRSLGHAGPVPSPTYTLVEPYELPGVSVYHIDLYRVSDEEELRYLGWHELDSGLRLVEWPDRAPSLERNADLLLQFSYADQGRAATVCALSDRGKMALQRLEAGFSPNP